MNHECKRLLPKRARSQQMVPFVSVVFLTPQGSICALCSAHKCNNNAYEYTLHSITFARRYDSRIDCNHNIYIWSNIVRRFFPRAPMPRLP